MPMINPPVSTATLSSLGIVLSKTNLSVAALGDSRISASNSPVGQSLISNIYSVAVWSEALSGGRVRFPYAMSFGVSGDASNPGAGLGGPGFLSRVAAVIASGAKICLVSDPTNDFNSSDPVTYNATIASMKSIFSQLIAAGITVITWIPLPRTNVSGQTTRVLTTSGMALQEEYARWLSRIGSNTAGLVVVDCTKQFWDQTQSGFQSLASGQLLYDGLHFSPQGGSIMGLAIANAIINITQPYSPLIQNNNVFDATTNIRGNLLSNGMMTGSVTAPTNNGGGTSSGNLPSYWSAFGVNCAGLTMTYSVASNRASCTITGTPTAGNWQCGWIQQMPGLSGGATGQVAGGWLNNVAVGDQVESYVSSNLSAGSTGIGGLRWRTNTTDATGSYGNYIFDYVAPTALGTIPATALNMTLHTEPLTLLGAPTSGYQALIAMGTNAVPASITFDMGNASLTKILP